MPSDCPKSAPISECRLHKYLAACGIASRRRCEVLIAEGRVSVNGRVVSAPGCKVSPERDIVHVDGRPVRPPALVYWLLHKPAGVLCTCQDPQGRRTFLDLLPAHLPRVFPVGRLDYESEGALLVTNDGALMQRLTHPRYGVAKRYRVWTDRPLTASMRRHLTRGIEVDGVAMRMASVVPVARKDPPVYDVVLREGRNRQIRRMLGALGVGVRRLVRTAIGPIALGSLPVGAARPLSGEEVAALRAAGVAGADMGDAASAGSGQEDHQRVQQAQKRP